MFLVVVSSPKPLNVAAPNFEGAYVTDNVEGTEAK